MRGRRIEAISLLSLSLYLFLQLEGGGGGGERNDGKGYVFAVSN